MRLSYLYWKYQIRQKMWIYWQSYAGGINHKRLWAIAALKLLCTRGGLADLLEALSLRLMGNWALSLVSSNLWTSHIGYYNRKRNCRYVYIDWDFICHRVLQASHCQDYYGVQSDRSLVLTRYQRSELIRETARFEGAPSVEELSSLDDRELAQEYLSAMHDYAMGQS